MSLHLQLTNLLNLEQCWRQDLFHNLIFLERFIIIQIPSYLYNISASWRQKTHPRPNRKKRGTVDINKKWVNELEIVFLSFILYIIWRLVIAGCFVLKICNTSKNQELHNIIRFSLTTKTNEFKNSCMCEIDTQQVGCSQLA